MFSHQISKAEQKYLHMKTKMKITLEDKLLSSEELRDEFNLQKIQMSTFRKERKNGTAAAALLLLVLLPIISAVCVVM